jgi:hypothetical protein
MASAAGGGPMNAGEESVHVVSYNMSVFSAQGYAGTLVKSSGGKPAANNSAGFFPSEARLLRRAEQLVDEGITTTNFFINALKHLSDQNGDIIGVQEYADTTLPLFKKYLEKERIKNDDQYKYNYEDFKLTLQPPGRVLTIWDKKFGDVAEKDGLRCVYESDFGRTPKLDGYEATGADNGRPISILKTSKGYFIMNFHGINRGKYKAGSSEESGIDVGPMIQAALNYHIAEAEKIFERYDKDGDGKLSYSEFRDLLTPLSSEYSSFQNRRSGSQYSGSPGRFGSYNNSPTKSLKEREEDDQHRKNDWIDDLKEVLFIITRGEYLL